MIGTFVTGLVFLAAIGSALIAGTFFAFSNFVMPALARLAPGAGAAAMQSINVTVLNRLFLGVFIGTAAVSLALVVAAVLHWDGDAVYRLAGGLLYLIGSFAVTVFGNVPLNRKLAALDAAADSSAAAWRHYVGSWTAWNHLRTLGSLAALGCFIAAFP
jgi:uncharacterized membrane protein